MTSTSLFPALSSAFGRWQSGVDATAMDRAIEEERERIVDPGHLVAEVVGDTEFAWDFRCLDAGFIDLIEPYWRVPSGVRHLLASTLEALDEDPQALREAVCLVEFVHMGVMINDEYCCHSELSRQHPDRRLVHALTQLRYAGQFLTVYPRYLLARNRFALDDEIQIRLHKLLSDMVVMQSMGRGVFLKWMYRGFGDIEPAWLLQHSANMLANYVNLPVLLGAVLAGQSRDTLDALKPALNHLAVALKLDMERNAAHGGNARPTAARGATANLLGLPITGLVHQGETVSSAPAPGNRFPLIDTQYERALQTAEPVPQEFWQQRIDRHVGSFVEALGHAGILVEWGEGLAVAIRGEGNHA